MRRIRKVITSKTTLEGAGVVLQRVFGPHELPLFDPFLLLDHFGSENPEEYLKGFPWHPHRGIETVTYMLQGKVEHADSMGNKGVINSGDIQWMTAGSGIIHQEMPQKYEGKMQGFQLWVNLPQGKKMTEPRYRGIKKEDVVSVVSLPGSRVGQVVITQRTGNEERILSHAVRPYSDAEVRLDTAGLPGGLAPVGLAAPILGSGTGVAPDNAIGQIRSAPPFTPKDASPTPGGIVADRTVLKNVVAVIPIGQGSAGDARVISIQETVDQDGITDPIVVESATR